MVRDSREKERRLACENCAHVFEPMFTSELHRCPRCGGRYVSRVLGWRVITILLLSPFVFLFFLWVWRQAGLSR
ncbi:MAG TPA: hypothetical protein VHM91_00295 [Verrucomicrobiales bacterium]|nr:hypothetical protein [Verrucomicrobiales bacterium]